MNKIHYIGITGFMDEYEVDKILPLFEHSDRKLMVGVLVSSRTYRGAPNTMTPNRYPFPIGKLKEIFSSNPNAFNVIHYCTDSERPSEIIQEMIGIRSKCQFRLHGFQLNMLWPDPINTVEVFKNLYPELQLILQIGKKAFSNQSPETVAWRIAEYAESIDYILFDPSGGGGTSFKSSEVVPYLRAIKEKNPDIGLAIAGGLSNKNIATQLGEIVQEFPDISIDAEARLRDEHDFLSIEKATEYVRKSLWLFAKDKVIH